MMRQAIHAFWGRLSGGRASWTPCLLLIGLLVASAFALRSYLYINPDVAFLVWAANEVMGPPVYGVDILDVNPPLGFLIYMPAVLMAPIFGFEWGIRLWMLCLSILSVSALWHTADKSLRLPVTTVLVLFVTLAYPHHFAQREQIALLLCAPYVAGPSSRRGLGVLIGVMAGIGFSIKPHFLIPLALVFALRRKIGVEERAIIAVGAVYAIVLLVFFQPYLFEMVPKAAANYWAISLSWRDIALQAGLFMFSAIPLAAGAAPQPAARPFFMAGLGFAIAALLQNKGFYYHYLPAFGFLVMFLTASLFNQKRFVAIAAALFLIVQITFLGEIANSWVTHYAKVMPRHQQVQAEIDSSASYVTLIAETYPAFPAAIYSPSRYAGMAIYQLFLPAVAKYELGLSTRDPEMAKRLALAQAIQELRRKPELVIVSPNEYDGRYFDSLEWYMRDEGFRELWKDYYPTRKIGRLTFYRRK
jgi:hypothetical protein